MGSFPKAAIMINGRTRVDYCKVTYASLRINNNARHNRNPATDGGAARNDCRRTHRIYDVIPDLPKMVTNPHASDVVSNSDKCLIDSFFRRCKRSLSVPMTGTPSTEERIGFRSIRPAISKSPAAWKSSIITFAWPPAPIIIIAHELDIDRPRSSRG